MAPDLFEAAAMASDLFEAAAPDLTSAGFGKSGRLATSAAAFSDSRLLAYWSFELSGCIGLILSKVPPVMPIDSMAVAYKTGLVLKTFSFVCKNYLLSPLSTALSKILC